MKMKLDLEIRNDFRKAINMHFFKIKPTKIGNRDRNKEMEGEGALPHVILSRTQLLTEGPFRRR